MASAQPDRDLTSTLHLGVRQVVENSPELRLTKNLELLTSQDRKVLAELSPKSSMLIVHRGPGKGARFLIGVEGAFVGRSVESDVFLDDVTVSRQHAQVLYTDGKYHLEDCGSLNGTYLNNISITNSALSTGDEIQIGKFHMLYFGGK